MSNWTKEDLIKHIKTNVNDYGAIIVVAALYKKLCGEMPEGLGLSGFQGDAINSVVAAIPKGAK